MNALYEALQRGRMDEASRRLFAIHFSHVEIREEPADPESGLPARLVVCPIWMGVDRPNTGGISTGNDRVLAERVQRAMVSGAAFCMIEVTKDVNQQSYVSATSLLLGRRLNADLKKLGY